MMQFRRGNSSEKKIGRRRLHSRINRTEQKRKKLQFLSGGKNNVMRQVTSESKLTRLD